MKPNNKIRIIPTICAFALTTNLALAERPEKQPATQVDTELLFLVEVPSSLSKEDFSSMMNSYSNAMQSASVIQAIQAGSTGSIAASMMFYGGSNQQVVGAGWTQISGLESATNFGNTLSSASYPFSGTGTSIGNALETGAKTFSSSNSNGFTSSAKIIDITAFNASSPAGKGSIVSSADADKAQRDKVFAGGVDTINGLSIGGAETGSYLDENIKGGRDSFSFTLTKEKLDSAMAAKISKEINDANAASPAAVPEPSSAALLGLGALTLTLRRKR